MTRKKQKGGRHVEAGRPCLGEVPLVPVLFRITRAQKQALVDAAKRAQMSQSQWVRLLLQDRFDGA